MPKAAKGRSSMKKKMPRDEIANLKQTDLYAALAAYEICMFTLKNAYILFTILA